MVKKPKKSDDDTGAPSPLAGTVKESAQQIWLAGLGAFSKAQEEGGKVFEALVKEGVTLQRRTQAVAEDRLAEATSRMTSMATDLSSKAAGRWDKLESIFEERVSRALKSLGVPTAGEVETLRRRVEELQRTVAALRSESSASASARAASRPASARKVAAKRPPTKASAKVAAKRAPGRKAAAG